MVFSSCKASALLTYFTPELSTTRVKEMGLVLWTKSADITRVVKDEVAAAGDTGPVFSSFSGRTVQTILE